MWTDVHTARRVGRWNVTVLGYSWLFLVENCGTPSSDQHIGEKATVRYHRVILRVIVRRGSNGDPIPWNIPTAQQMFLIRHTPRTAHTESTDGEGSDRLEGHSRCFPPVRYCFLRTVRTTKPLLIWQSTVQLYNSTRSGKKHYSINIRLYGVVYTSTRRSTDHINTHHFP